MLPFFRQKVVPAGPHEFGAEIEIERPASEVYPLLDLADPRHAKRQLGDRVQAVTGEAGTFTMVVSELPDAVFTLAVTAEKREREYAFSCVSEPTFGRVARSHEHYVLDDMGEQGCRLILTQTIEFDRELSEDEYGMEAMMLAFSGFSALAKIKLHAEEGVEAVKAMSKAQMAALDDFDCLD